jgi:pimeloyl-ACP methyl ester carboxylesterase
MTSTSEIRQTHYFPRSLGGGDGCRVYWSTEPVGDAVVFVHGFNGSPSGTWLNFQSMLPREHTCAGTDLIFYGYDSLRTRARISGLRLRDFLDTLFSQPRALIVAPLDPTTGRPPTFGYHRVTLVAHSLGAVVARQALLEAHAARLSWVPKVRLVLFAPAQMGANVVGLACAALTHLELPVIGALADTLKMWFQVLQDLEPSAELLRQLREKTEQAIVKEGAAHLQPRTVVLAERDRVINPDAFPCDPVPKMYRGKGHIDVCKPHKDFAEPIRDVLS